MGRAQSVETRRLAPAAVADDEEAPAGLYVATPQLTAKPKWEIAFQKVNARQANQWLREADAVTDFKQRPTRTRGVRRWSLLMETGRFVEYLPDGPLIFDEQGIMMNGKHRMTALAGQDKSFGFMIIKGVPRWMFAYFDTGAQRTLNDVFTISGNMTAPQAGSTMRLAMRYEEFLWGVRREIGWKDWGSERDEHADVTGFLERRERLTDIYTMAARSYRTCKIVIASLMVFRYYQELAWPEGEPQLKKFLESLAEGTGFTTKDDPALVLREWAKDVSERKERIFGKRELHLLLLYRHFQWYCQGRRVSKVNWANGFPMAMPFHPDGADVGVENVRQALLKLDREAGLDV